MKLFNKFSVAVVFALFAVVSSAQAGETVRLSVAASMTNVMKDVIALYAKNNSTTVIPNFGPSGGLAKQINQGAPADVYISANQKWMNFLRDQEMIDPASEVGLAQNTLVFVGTPNPDMQSIKDIVQLKQVAIGSPKSVPAGEYAAQAMENAGIYKTMQAENKLAMAKDVRQALAYADRGETAGAFVYKTDALLATQAKILFEVPQELYKPVRYPLALTKTGAKNKAAKDFYTFLRSPEAVAVLEQYGFSPAK
nr:molybdate ABC transporter substrate-binding protein [uncultured Desulfobulbus sp.]